MNSCNDCKYPKCCKVGIFAALTMAVSSTLYYGYKLYLKKTNQDQPKEDTNSETQ
jgi:hypothetical protein